MSKKESGSKHPTPQETYQALMKDFQTALENFAKEHGWAVQLRVVPQFLPIPKKGAAKPPVPNPKGAKKAKRAAKSKK